MKSKSNRSLCTQRPTLFVGIAKLLRVSLLIFESVIYIYIHVHSLLGLTVLFVSVIASGHCGLLLSSPFIHSFFVQFFCHQCHPPPSIFFIFLYFYYIILFIIIIFTSVVLLLPHRYRYNINTTERGLPSSSYLLLFASHHIITWYLLPIITYRW